MAQGEAHAEHVEGIVAERQRFAPAPHERSRERSARLAQHAAARIDAHHAPGVAQDIDRPPRDQTGAGRDVEEAHAPAQAGPLESLAPIHWA